MLSMTEAVPDGRPGDGDLVFRNECPGGLQFLCPILFTMKKETEELVLEISKCHENEIRKAIF